MSRLITQPINQVRLTNVAVVRLTRGGHRFEVACYRNKIVNYRQGTETDLSEVLQTERVFTNVSKGLVANSKALLKCFDTADEEAVCRLILDRGDVQVSDQERAARLESTLREVASMVSEKCVHPASRRPYTATQVRGAMKRAGFMVHPTRNVKQQFLDCVRLLQKKGALEIERAKMRLSLVLLGGGSDADGVDDSHNFADRRKNAVDLLLAEGVARSDIEAPNNEGDPRITFQSDPSLYRKVEGIARDPSVRGRLEIVQQCVSEEGDATLGSELERRAQQQQQHVYTDRESENEQSGHTKMEEDAKFTAAGNSDVPSLSNKLQSTTLAANDDPPSPPDDDGSRAPRIATKTNNDDGKAAANSRKAQKAQQKKSKKARRREREAQAEREQRAAAEEARQRQRNARLGITDVNEGGGDNCNDGSSPGDGKLESDKGGIPGEGGGVNTKPCNTCGGAFAPGEYRSHFRSDWHRYNVKLKLKGVAPVSEKEFLLCDSDAFFD